MNDENNSLSMKYLKFFIAIVIVFIFAAGCSFNTKSKPTPQDQTREKEKPIITCYELIQERRKMLEEQMGVYKIISALKQTSKSNRQQQKAIQERLMFMYREMNQRLDKEMEQCVQAQSAALFPSI